MAAHEFTTPSTFSTSRPVRWWLAAALLPFLVVAVASFAHPPAATDGDYAQYLLHAKAIAEGRSYSDIGYIYTDLNLVGPANQPPGWPLVLAPFVRVFGMESPVIKLLVVLLIGAFALIAGQYHVRRGEALAGVLVAATVPLTLELQRATGSALSDPLFCVLVWATLCTADQAGSWRRSLVVALLAVAALSVRVAGVALVPALLLHALLRQRSLTLRALAPWLGLGLLVVVLGVVASDHIPFMSRMTGVFTGLPDRAQAVAMTYRFALSDAALHPFASPMANDIWHLIAAVPLVVGAWRWFTGSVGSPAWCFALFYGVVLVFAPVREPRYAWPLAPIVTMWIVTGAMWLAGRIPRPAVRTLAPRVVAATMAIVTAGATLQLARRPAPRSLQGDPDTIQVFEWARAELQKEGSRLRVVFPNPRVLTLETGVPAMGIPSGPDSTVLAELEVKRISHVVLPIQPSRIPEHMLATLALESPLRFPVLFRNATYDVRRFVAVPDSTGAASGSSLTQPR